MRPRIMAASLGAIVGSGTLGILWRLADHKLLRISIDSVAMKATDIWLLAGAILAGAILLVALHVRGILSDRAVMGGFFGALCAFSLSTLYCLDAALRAARYLGWPGGVNYLLQAPIRWSLFGGIVGLVLGAFAQPESRDGAAQSSQEPGSSVLEPIPHRLLLWNALGLGVIALCLAGVGSLLTMVSTPGAAGSWAALAMGVSVVAILRLFSVTGGRIVSAGLREERGLIVLEGVVALVANLAFGGYMLLLFTMFLHYSTGG